MGKRAITVHIYCKVRSSKNQYPTKAYLHIPNSPGVGDVLISTLPEGSAVYDLRRRYDGSKTVQQWAEIPMTAPSGFTGPDFGGAFVFAESENFKRYVSPQPIPLHDHFREVYQMRPLEFTEM